MSGLSLRTIQSVESGQSASLETLKSLAAVFEIDVDTLKGDVTVIDKKSEEWALAPAWVKFGFWGIRDRRVAIRFEIFSLMYDSLQSTYLNAGAEICALSDESEKPRSHHSSKHAVQRASDTVSLQPKSASTLCRIISFRALFTIGR